jgi:predicted  nucleic acid-binding Zn-ribbon protein
MLLNCKCGHSFGARQGARASCSRCGESDKITTTAVFSDSARLAQAVATANLPTEIRAEVESKMKKENLRREASRERAGVDTIHRILRDSTDAQGVLTIARLRDNLAAEGIAEPTAEQVVGSAEERGVVHRSGQEQWRWLA